MQFNIFKHFRVLRGVRDLSSPSTSGQGYTPHGKGTPSSGGSGTTGGGTSQTPSGGSEGQTNTSGGSGTNTKTCV
ncbi:hypothetical protein F5146DRAFT_1133888 [Armillaria mellea]|nr:hypothetical protein F5146DRAFT_1133888 [Armillaria mellea]